MSDEDLVAAFEDATLPFASWTHEAHLRVACVYLMRLGPIGALEHMRTRIRAFNAAHRVPNSPDRGYHETITVAWLRVLAPVVGGLGGARGSLEILDLVPQFRERDFLLRFYSRQRLASPGARAAYLEPDIAPFDPGASHEPAFGAAPHRPPI